ncbi:MAG: hypothetical protein KGL90_08040 [Burkholderiales bacterium]|nr:hypothetical protein [Burkholderiales bacterium]
MNLNVEMDAKLLIFNGFQDHRLHLPHDLPHKKLGLSWDLKRRKESGFALAHDRLKSSIRGIRIKDGPWLWRVQVSVSGIHRPTLTPPCAPPNMSPPLAPYLCS